MSYTNRIKMFYKNAHWDFRVNLFCISEIRQRFKIHHNVSIIIYIQSRHIADCSRQQPVHFDFACKQYLMVPRFVFRGSLQICTHLLMIGGTCSSKNRQCLLSSSVFSLVLICITYSADGSFPFKVTELMKNAKRNFASVLSYAFNDTDGKDTHPD